MEIFNQKNLTKTSLKININIVSRGKLKIYVKSYNNRRRFTLKAGSTVNFGLRGNPHGTKGPLDVH